MCYKKKYRNTPTGPFLLWLKKYYLKVWLLTQKPPLSSAKQEEPLMRRQIRDQVVPWRKRTLPFLSPCHVSPALSPDPEILSPVQFDLCHAACLSRTLAPSHFAFALYLDLGPFPDLDLVPGRYLPTAMLKILKHKKRKPFYFFFSFSWRFIMKCN